MTHWSEFVDADGPDGAYLSWKKVADRVGISRTTAWRLQKAGDFPKPYVISPGRVAYRESEVEAWKASRGQRAAMPLASPKAPMNRAVQTALPPLRPPESSRLEVAGPPSVRQPALALGPAAELTPQSPARASAPSRPRRRGESAQMRFDF